MTSSCLGGIIALIHCGLLGIYYTPGKVLLRTVKPVLVKRDFFFPLKGKTNKAFACVAYTYRKSEPVPHVAFLTDVLLAANSIISTR